jgi:hypothetical protein
MEKAHIDIDNAKVQEAASVVLVAILRQDPEELIDAFDRLKVAAARWWEKDPSGAGNASKDVF